MGTPGEQAAAASQAELQQPLLVDAAVSVDDYEDTSGSGKLDGAGCPPERAATAAAHATSQPAQVLVLLRMECVSARETRRLVLCLDMLVWVALAAVLALVALRLETRHLAEMVRRAGSSCCGMYAHMLTPAVAVARHSSPCRRPCCADVCCLTLPSQAAPSLRPHSHPLPPPARPHGRCSAEPLSTI
jgi:hypothetical protein